MAVEFDEAGLVPAADRTMGPVNAFPTASVVVVLAAYGCRLALADGNVTHHVDVRVDFDPVCVADINLKNAVRTATGNAHRSYARNDSAERDFGFVGVRVLGCKKAGQITRARVRGACTGR